MKKSLAILGSTGSIGVNTLEVVRAFPERFEVVALGGGRNVDLLQRQIEEFRPRCAAVLTEELRDQLRERLNGADAPEIFCGPEGYVQAATEPSADVLVSAIVGAAGLLPTLRAVEAGKTIALANKETLVVAGELVMDLAGRKGVPILPVDSEHSAIFQSLQGNPREALRRILLTASGGPFFRKTPEELAEVKPEAALRHPNWDMGAKITIDSATLMNKGLEVIEACRLFQVDLEQIEVYVHPESIVHSMVEYVDGSVIAQLGIPDMRVPIAYALSYPDRLPVELPRLDLLKLGALTFYPPDYGKFPCLRLAFEACRAGATLPAVLNAANEVAVSGFLEGKIDFPGIPNTIERVLGEHSPAGELSLDAIVEADGWAREAAARIVAG
jgi:1-deoxy-D-xylulose-5-phosphate reductoisomerase